MNRLEREVIELRLDGCTFREIADTLDISITRARDIVMNMLQVEHNPKMIENTRFPYIKRWMKINHYTCGDLAGMLDVHPNSIYRKLCGRSEFTLSEIMTLLDLMGEAFETAFDRRNRDED